MSLADTHFIPNNYTPVGDLTAVAVCFVMLALVCFSYIRKTAAFRVFLVLEEVHFPEYQKVFRIIQRFQNIDVVLLENSHLNSLAGKIIPV